MTNKFTINVSNDETHVEFHPNRLHIICNQVSFVTGNRFNRKSNISEIIQYIKNEWISKGYNQVTCIKNDLVIYNELIIELKHIPGLTVILE